MAFDIDKLQDPIIWNTISGHPASGIKYQEAYSNLGLVARVTKSGYEIVSPSDDTDQVYREYNGRVQNYIHGR